MITFIYGENNYQARQLLRQLLSEFSDKNAIERFDSSQLEPGQLPDILRGASLFSPQKMVVIDGASENKPVWMELAEHLESLPDELSLVIFEGMPDKRTKTYKLLQKIAQLHECRPLSQGEAIKWLETEAKQRDLNLTPADSRQIVERAGLDQWQLSFALEKLALIGSVTRDTIENLIEPSPEANVFDMIDAALAGDKTKLQREVKAAKLSQDPYQFFGLLSGQIFQLVTLASTKKTAAEVARDLNVHPYPLQKVSGLARRLSGSDIKKIVQVVAGADDKLKRSGADPWEIVELALLKLTVLRKNTT